MQIPETFVAFTLEGGADDSGRFIETPSERIHALRCVAGDVFSGFMPRVYRGVRDSAPAWAVDLIDFQHMLWLRVERRAGFETVAIFR